MITIVIKGKFEGLNQYVKACRSNRYGANALIRKSERVIRKAIGKQVTDILMPPVTLIYTFYEPNKRRDKDNISAFFHKVFQDSLVKEGRLENDGWDQVESFHDYFAIDKADPRVEVKILEAGD